MRTGFDDLRVFISCRERLIDDASLIQSNAAQPPIRQTNQSDSSPPLPQQLYLPPPKSVNLSQHPNHSHTAVLRTDHSES